MIISSKLKKNGVELDEDQLKTLTLTDIKNRLQSSEMHLKMFGLHEPTEAELEEADFNQTNSIPALIKEELDFDIEELTQFLNHKRPQMTESQKNVFETTMEAVESNHSLVVFIDARGGTGKTFVLNAILAAVRCLEPNQGGSVALATGTTGKAATLLPLGRTFHSRFKAPLNPLED